MCVLEKCSNTNCCFFVWGPTPTCAQGLLSVHSGISPGGDQGMLEIEPGLVLLKASVLFLLSLGFNSDVRGHLFNLT